jgi:sugar lactone lactonase YvrE
VDSDGAVYIADFSNNRVRKVTVDGRISTVAGTSYGFSGDGGPATAARLYNPSGVAVGSDGTLYIADLNNHRVRKVTPDGLISTVAGASSGFAGDGGPAASARLAGPQGVTVDGSGNLYIADTGNRRVRKVTADGKITTVAGSGSAGSGGDNGPAVSAQLGEVRGIAVDSAGTVYIVDQANNVVRKVTADGKISAVAGTGKPGFEGDGGPAAAAQFRQPFGVAVDCVDTLYITDYGNNRVRRISSARLAGLPDSGTVASLASVRSRLRLAVLRESVKDGAEVCQSLAAPSDHQRWRLVAAGQEAGEVLYTIENVRSGKVLEVAGAQEADGAAVAQRAYEGAGARHQQWRLIPVDSPDGAQRVYEIANRNSGLLLRAESNAPTAIRQNAAQGDPRDRQWRLLPV